MSTTNHTLLIKTTITDKKFIHEVKRPRGFREPDNKPDMARIMEHEINGLTASFQDVVDFWVKRKMIDEQTAYGIMAKFCIERAQGMKSDMIEVVDAERMQRLPTIKEILKNQG